MNIDIGGGFVLVRAIAENGFDDFVLVAELIGVN